MRWTIEFSKPTIVYLVLMSVLLIAAEPVRGADDGTAAKLNSELVRLLKAGQFVQALAVGKRAVAATERAFGPKHTNLAAVLNNLALVQTKMGNLDDAEALYKRSLAIRKDVLGADHVWVARALNNLAELYRAKGRFSDAETLLRQAAAIYVAKLGDRHAEVANVQNNLAGIFDAQGRYGEAEPLYKRALAIREATLGRNHPDVSGSLNNLASLYEVQQRLDEAEALYRRSLKIRESANGASHPTVAIALNNLAGLLDEKGQHEEAEALYKRSLSIRKNVFGNDHPDIASAQSNLATLYRKVGRLTDADRLYAQAMASLKRSFGSDHPRFTTILNNIGLLRNEQGQLQDAKRILKQALQARKNLGADHPSVGITLNNLAWVHLKLGDFRQAANYWKKTTEQIKRRMTRGLGGSRRSAIRSEAVRDAWKFHGLVKMSFRLSTPGTAEHDRHARAMFEIAQLAQFSQAAQSVAKMAARSAASTPLLSRLVRERQDLIAEWQANDNQLVRAKAKAPNKRDTAREAALNKRLLAIDRRIVEVDARLSREFSEYRALSRPTPVTIAQVQAQLAQDEALVLLLDTTEFEQVAEETFVWLVTRNKIRWVRSKFGTATLTSEVRALRCGLDATAWYGDGRQDCLDHLDLNFDAVPEPGDLLPFDRKRAHGLYRALFGEVEDLIAGKRLIVIPSGPLTQLPLHVLIANPPTAGDHTKTAWLARRHAISVLPAVSSLRALRQFARPSQANKPLIGFGNPLLDGPDARFSQRAAAARARQHCRKSAAAITPTATRNGAPLSRAVNSITMRSGLADVGSLRRQVPLPETANELCIVAQQLAAEPGEINLGSRARERRIKALSASGTLAQYRSIHFATHATLAGQLKGTSEPGLILTPPEAATAEDDGYLSGSEIASLRLDADWVILSACNTAGGADGANTEALSGLARVFFYAGARALMVSHWEVYSDATVKLITKAVRTLANDRSAGRAEALRRAMLDMIDNGTQRETHPSYWAPFVVVGEGSVHH